MGTKTTGLVWIAAVTFGLAGPAWGGPDLQFDIGAQAEYDPNVGRTETDDIGSAVFRVVPRIQVIEDQGNLRYDVAYTPYYQYTTRREGIRGFQHHMKAGTSYLVGDRTKFLLTDAFRYSESVDTVDNISAEGGLSVSTGNKPVSRNTLYLMANHMFTPRLFGKFSTGWRLFDSNLYDRANNNSFSGDAGLNYVWSPVHTFGIGASANYQLFDEARGGQRPKRQTYFVSLHGAWTWAIDETTSFEFSVGPTYVNSSQDIANERTLPIFPLRPGHGERPGHGFDAKSCPGDPMSGYRLGPGCKVQDLDSAQYANAEAAGPVSIVVDNPFGSGSKTTWTGFGSAALNKRWRPDLVSSLIYKRSASTASGLGSSFLDNVGLLSTWDISELWNVSLRVDFTMRESVAPTQDYVVLVANREVGAPGMACGGVSPTCLASVTAIETEQTNEDINTIRWQAAARVNYKFTRHLSASLRYTFADQTSESDTLGASSDFQDHLVTLGIQYHFDRLNLW